MSGSLLALLFPLSFLQYSSTEGRRGQQGIVPVRNDVGKCVAGVCAPFMSHGKKMHTLRLLLSVLQMALGFHVLKS